MKKEYMKPEVSEIEVAANQAVAGCGFRKAGYDNSWQRGDNGQFGWPTPEAAWNAYSQHDSFTFSTTKQDNAPYVFPVYYGESVDDSGEKIYGTFHDENGSGLMDNGEYVAWQKGDSNAVAAMLRSGVTNIAS